MKCQYCGKTIDEDSSFCNFCGKKQRETSSRAKARPVRVKVQAHKADEVSSKSFSWSPVADIPGDSQKNEESAMLQDETSIPLAEQVISSKEQQLNPEVFFEIQNAPAHYFSVGGWSLFFIVTAVFSILYTFVNYALEKAIWWDYVAAVPLMILLALTAVLLCRAEQSFKFVYYTYLACHWISSIVLIITLDSLGIPANYNDLAKSLLLGILWILYFQQSVRVKCILSTNSQNNPLKESAQHRQKVLAVKICSVILGLTSIIFCILAGVYLHSL